MEPACGAAGKLYWLPPRNQRWILCPIMQEINLFLLECYVLKKSYQCYTDQIKQLKYLGNFGFHVKENKCDNLRLCVEISNSS